MARGKLLFKASALKSANMLISIAIAFVMMPFVISSLGNKWYGIWVLLGTLIAYYEMLDLGMSNAVQRFLAVAVGKNDHSETEATLSSSLCVFLLIAALVLLLSLMAVVLTPHFVADQTIVNEVRLAVFIMGINAALSFPAYCYSGIITANLRYDILSLAHLLKMLARNFLMYLALSDGAGIVELALITFLVLQVANLIVIRIGRGMLPSFRFSLAAVSRPRIRDLFSYSSYVFVRTVADSSRIQIGSFIIAAFLSISVLVYFNIAARLSDYALKVIKNGFGVSFGLFARYHGEGNVERMRDVATMLSKWAMVLAALVSGGMIIMGHAFISIWMGPAYVDAYPPLVLFALAVVCLGYALPGVNLLMVTGQQRKVALLAVFELVLNTVIAVSTVAFLGTMGVALGVAVAALISGVFIQNWMLSAALGLNYRVLIQQFFGLLTVLGLLQLPLGWYVQTNQPGSYTELLLVAVVYYLPLMYLIYLVVLKAEDRTELESIVPALRFVPIWR